MAKRKFKLLAGMHISDDGVEHRWNDPETCVVESDQDLVAKFGRDRFEPVQHTAPRPPARIRSREEYEAWLDLLHERDLRAHAEEAEVDVSHCESRESVLEALKEA